MAEDLGVVGELLPVLGSRLFDRTPLSLEMDREGVKLRLASALFDNFLALDDLVLRVPYVGRSFDYTSGPRALQPAVTRLAGVTVHVLLERLIGRIWAPAGSLWTVLRARGVRGRVVLSGTAGAVPFTVRVHVETSTQPGAVRLRFVSPCLWAPSELPWDLLPAHLVRAVPESLRVGSGDDWVDVSILRPVLSGLTANLGYKVPLLDGAMLSDVRIETHRVSLVFGAQPTGIPDDAVRVGVSPVPGASAEEKARAALGILVGGVRDPALIERFLCSGVSVPRLAPEVLARARSYGEDRPEAMLPHLVAAVVVARDPSLASEHDALRIAKRLVAAVEADGDPLEMVLAGRLLARIGLSVSPETALAILDVLLIRGIEDAAVLEAAAFALDRLGRREEARVTRSRVLALVPVGRTASTLRDMVARLESAGLEDVAADWLEQTIAQCDQDTFGSEGAAIRRQAVLLLATRESLTPDRAEAARGRLRDLLHVDPCDREALDLLLALASCGREAAEAVSRFKSAADASSGESRAMFLVDAAGATMERLGLRRQAVDLLEAAREVSPRNEAIAAALDRLYQELDLGPRRLALIEHRVAWTDDPVRRSTLRLEGAVLADGLGRPSVAVNLLRPLLDEDPTHVPALRLAVVVARASGDEAFAKRAAESLVDLDPGPVEPVRQVAAGLVEPVRQVAVGPADGAVVEHRRHGPPPITPDAVTNDAVVDDEDAEIDRFEAEARWLKTRVAKADADLVAGDAVAALDAALDALRTDPVHVGALRLAVAAATASGRLDEAADLGRRWVDRLFSPAEQVSALIEMADVERLRSDDTSGPTRMLARAASIAPEDPRVLQATLNLARLHPEHAAGVMVPVVAAAASGALEQDSAGVTRIAARLYEVAGVAWDELGAIEAATAILEVVVGLDPDHEAARSDLAILYQASGRGESARAILEGE